MPLGMPSAACRSAWWKMLTQPLGARGEPQVLHGADAAVQVHGFHVGAPHHHRAGAFAVAGDANADGRLNDAFELEALVHRALLAFEHIGRLGMRLGKSVVHAAFGVLRLHHQKIPRLHEAQRGRVVRRREDAAEHLVGHRRGQKLPAHIAARKNGVVNGVAGLLCEGVNAVRGLRRCGIHCSPLCVNR